VIAGALATSAGFAAVALAGAPWLLALGIGLAGASAGLCWSPFNDAAARVVPADVRATALSVVSTGSTIGVVAAAGIAFAVTEGVLDWRGAWAGFAAGGLVLATIAWTGLPPASSSAVFSFWSVRLFSERSTLMAFGGVLGPALAGVLAAAQGPALMFLTAAIPSVAMALWFGAQLRRDRPRLAPVSDG
jgi:predicted MFS family arabinose efflux permease